MAGPPMPQIDYGKRDLVGHREFLVRQFGEATVSMAEVTTAVKVLFMTGIVKPAEFLDEVQQQCRRIDYKRRAEARLDEDRG